MEHNGYEIIDPSEVPPESLAAPVTKAVLSGLTVFVPKGGSKPNLGALRKAGLLRRQRRMTRDGIEGTAFWAVVDDLPRRKRVP